ncbi:MAG: endonuclease domain-containing protein [Bacteroidota bacterium]
MKKENKGILAHAPRSPEGEVSRTLEMHFGAQPSTFKNAQFLRDNETKTEKLLWSRLRNKQLGVKFRRQHPIGNYIADFYCHKAQLVIELDGIYHERSSQRKTDKLRDEVLEELGIRILHFTDDEVINDMPSIITKIELQLSVGSPLGD